MKTLKIFSDSPLSDVAEKILRDGVLPHEVIFSEKSSVSVLSQADLEAGFDAADIAFGQPDVPGILRSKRLRWVQLTSASYTRYDTPEFRAAVAARGLWLTNSSSVYAGPCAEHVLAFMLAHARRLPQALGSGYVPGSPGWNQLRNAGLSPRNQKAVLLGFGAIALRLVELLHPFDMHIVALRRRPRGDEGIPIVTLEGLPHELANADHVVNILPDSAETFRFISAERLAAMKHGAVFYNVGRGRTVDQDALLTALQSGHLDAAWLDVTDPEPLPPDHPLRSTSNCFITPHTAGGHCNESESLVRHFLNNFRRFQNGAPLCNRIM